MPDYIYLLETRLSPAQRKALKTVQEAARGKGQTTFLVGGAVRDLTSGSPVRDLDVVVQGNALKLKKDMVGAGAVVTGEYEPGQSLHLLFPGSVRMEFGSTLTVSYPKPGKPVFKPANILDDLRRRDFTVNAMALSLNEGSYGLLMDPLNGVADIENRQLRLVSNYGFIEDPVRMIRAARYTARLGWTMDEKTQSRYETGKQEGYMSALAEYPRGYETEEIAHEEDPLRIIRGLEAEGWMKVLAPFWTAAKANVAEMERMRDVQTQLQMQGMAPDTAAANFPLLTAKLSPKEVATLKASFPRQGFVTEIEELETEAKEFAAQLGGKGAALPSQAWKMLSAARPEVVLWTAFSSKSGALQAKFQSFYKEWPQVRQRMPYVMMQEMRIVPELPGYEALLESLFFELMDGKLTTPEEMKAFLEPFSPPAPPPPVNMRRPRAAKKEAKPAKSRSKKVVAAEDAEQEDATVEASASEPDAAPEAPPPAAKKVPAKKIATEKPAAPAPAAPVKKTVAPVKTPPPARKAAGNAPATKTPAPAKKVVAPAKKSVPAKKAVPAKKTPAKNVPAKKAVAPAKKATPVKKPVAPTPAKKVAAKAVPAKKSIPAKKTAPAKKAVPAKKSVPAKKAAPAKKTIPAKKAPAKAGKRR